MKKLLLNLFFTILLTSLQSLLAQTVFLVDVQKTSNTSATGVIEVNAEAWNNACGSLQTAIDAASANDQIWVRSGIYEPAGDASSFIMKEGVQIYGHFAGSETSLSQRNLRNNGNRSTLHADDLVMTGADLTAATILDGFTFTSTGNSSYTRGIELSNASPVIRNCIFEGLKAELSGAAIYIINSSPAISNCIFRNNTSGYAGAVYTVNGSPTFTNCEFNKNAGTAMYNDASNIVLANCTFFDNKTNYGAQVSLGGAVYNKNGTTSTISGSVFNQNNNDQSFGGAIWDEGSSSTITRTTFTNNAGKGQGGAIASTGSEAILTITNCTIQNNTISEGSGGGIFTSGSLMATNCHFYNNNAAGSGGAVYGKGTFVNTIMAYNYAPSVGGADGGGTFTNCLITMNTSNSHTSGLRGMASIKNSIIWENTASEPDDFTDIAPDPESTYANNIIGKGYSGPGSMNVNPQFVDANQPAGLRLKSCSPAIDAGNNEGVTTVQDIGEESRIFNNTVDIGPYELQQLPDAPLIAAAGPLAICPGGSVVLSAPEGYGNSYSWSPGSAATSTLTASEAGTYTVSITSESSCTTISTPIVVTNAEVPAIPVVTASGPLAICENGSVVLSAPEGYGDSYLWAPGNIQGRNLTVTEAGIYTVSMNLPGGCTTTSLPVEITTIGVPVTPVITANGPVQFCSGGSVELANANPPANETPGVSFKWNTGPETQSILANESGSYTLIATNEAGCSSPSNEIVVTVNQNPPSPAIDAAQPDCTSPTGNITIMEDENTSDFFTYSLGNGAYQSQNTFDGLLPGDYMLQVKDIHGCISVGDFTMNAQPELMEIPLVTASGSLIFCADNPVTLSTPEGFASYVWNPGGVITPSVAPVSSGSYSVTVTNAAGCSATSAAIEITVYDLPASNVLTITQPSCTEAYGSVTVDPNNTDAAGYSYSLDEGVYQNTCDFRNLIPGLYVLRIMNANSCITVVDITINTPPSPTPVPVVTASATEFCAGNAVLLFAPDGFESYTWSNGQSGATVIEVWEAGTYTVTVTGSFCSATSAPVVLTRTVPIVPVLTVTQPTCSEPAGTITVQTNENTPAGYTYALNDGAYQESNVFTDLQGGNYTVWAKSPGSCYAQTNTVIKSSEIIVAANGPANFCAGTDLQLSVPEGFASYSWSSGENASSITVANSGNYTVTVTDAAGCSRTSQPFVTSRSYPVLYVDQSVGASGDGGSWATAYKEFREAVAATQAHRCVSEIRVASGTYMPTSGTDRNSTFAFLRGGIKIYGGYASGGSSRNAAVNPTILSGDIGAAGNLGDNSRHVIAIAGIPDGSDSLVIDGFTIKLGYADAYQQFEPTLNDVEISSMHGAGIYATQNGRNFGLLIRNCIFTENYARQLGGGIYFPETSLTIRSCLFQNNVAQVGGAMISFSSNHSLTVSNSAFISNISDDSGGALCIYTSSDIKNSVFDSNVSYRAGGALYGRFANIRLSGCTFSNNSADVGGGIYFYYTSLLLSNNTFYANHASEIGGAMKLELSSTTINNNIIWGNTSPEDPTFFVPSGDFPVIRNSIVQDIGPGNNNLNTDPMFVNAANPAGADGVYGTADDGLRVSACSPAINNGNNSYVPAELLTDLSGASRKYGTVDAGAYELQKSNVAEGLLAANNEVATGPIRSGEKVFYSIDGADCEKMVAIESTGGQPVAGNVTTKVWIEASQPAQYLKRHYEITPAENPETATALVTLYATDAEFAAFNSQSPAPANLLPLSTDDAQTLADRIANIQVEKRDGTSSDGSGLPASYTGAITTITPVSVIWNSTAERWEITFAVTGFSGFFIKTQSTPLPVRWISVTAVLNIENQPVIKWEVQETSVASYAIQKSTDARRFESIGEVAGLGDGLNHYTFTDNDALEGSVYYRISQTDLDGTTTFSRIVTIGGKSSAPAPSVYPIPAKNEVFVIVKSQTAEADYKVTLTDLKGRNLKTQALLPGTNKVAIQSLNAGIYLLRTSRGEIFKIIKE